MTVIIRFLNDESGATAVEYAIVAGGIAMAIVAAIALVGGATSAKFDSITAAVE